MKSFSLFTCNLKDACSGDKNYDRKVVFIVLIYTPTTVLQVRVSWNYLNSPFKFDRTSGRIVPLISILVPGFFNIASYEIKEFNKDIVGDFNKLGTN